MAATKGVCFPQGFLSSGIRSGIRKNRLKLDLALVTSQTRAAAAAVYTTNKVKGAPILVTQEHLADGYAQAIIVNSGIANTCTADGHAIAGAMCALVEQHAGIPQGDVIVASTGVIGEPLPIMPIATGMPDLVVGLKADSLNAAHAIMTTDTYKKEAGVTFTLGGKECRIGGMAKGSGMIHPNMATMLAFLTCDAAAEPSVLQAMLKEAADDTFNLLSVDGDTSTNDMLCILSNGMAGNPPVTDAESPDGKVLQGALKEICRQLCKLLAADGEGASHLLECNVHGAATVADARKLARSVVSSNLTKAAFYGADANWGRILCAMGYSGADFNPAKVEVVLRSEAGSVIVCENGAGVGLDEDFAKRVLTEKAIHIDITCGDGAADATAYGCDLTYEYVKINGDYRT
ncbi:MAG: bifunctional glutamate N-acetyltransferase/amino-acid acetyltransferase ArgJ [Oscillospiraceae bacterium]|nr:bifunctional glutamate N-acetyltransferase/amino-acid acetyltransferase ArgJ [Oscillospiraceae bacterium]